MVDIIPKQQEVQLSFIILVVVVVVLIVVVGAYGFVTFLKIRTADKLSQLTEQLAQQKSPEESALQSRILSTKAKLDDFAILAIRRQNPLSFFAFIENNTHPNTVFSSLSLNPSEGKAVLNGEIRTFRMLEEQIEQLRAQEEITEVNLTALSLGEVGQVNFVFMLKFKSVFFRTL